MCSKTNQKIGLKHFLFDPHNIAQHILVLIGLSTLFVLNPNFKNLILADFTRWLKGTSPMLLYVWSNPSSRASLSPASRHEAQGLRSRVKGRKGGFYWLCQALLLGSSLLYFTKNRGQSSLYLLSLQTWIFKVTRNAKSYFLWLIKITWTIGLASGGKTTMTYLYIYP